MMTSLTTDEAASARPRGDSTPVGTSAGADEGLDTPTFTISQLAEAFEVTPRALRFYETKGLLNPRRNGQTRLYSRRDRARLSLVLRGKRVGFSLTEIKEMLDLYDLENGHETQWRHALAKFQERIDALERQRKDIDDAITELRDQIGLVEGLIQSKKNA
jgi:DNA-binding transcriptional MerR regulator